MRNKGFTLIELMIVVAIIAIIAAIAIPGLLRARISANEGSAVGTLRTLSTSQAQFQSQAMVDQDQDGTGEYGLLGELSGEATLRASGGVAKPAFITSALTPEDSDSFGTKSGYQFQVYLPGIVTDNIAFANGTDSADNQENKWRGYAWPVTAKTTGNRVFAVDQGAEVFATPNRAGSFSGATAPAYDEAVNDASVSFDENIVKTKIGVNVWTPAG